jgi:hypothetical protein
LSIKEENHFEVVLIGVTESPVERPKKTAIELIWQEKTSYTKDTNSNRQDRPKILCTAFEKGADMTSSCSKRARFI